ncbi:MFS transporter [Streptococcus pluranimalium]|uniref:MFS transporter n=1 Tax=Streptococcus pluranimalium TaxID=82348 RepID=UPI003F67A52E
MLGFAKDLLLSFSGGLLMLYLTDSLTLATALAGGILSFNRLFDMMNDFIVAYLLDKFPMYLKQWYLLGMVGSLIILVALFSVATYVPKALIVFAVFVLYFILEITFSLMDVGYWSLLPRLSNNEDMRQKLSTTATFFSSLAALVCFTSVMPWLQFFGSEHGFTGLTLVIASLVAVVVAFTYPHLPNPKVKNTEVRLSLSLKDIYQIIFQNRLFLSYILYFFFFQLSFEWMNAYNIYYFKYSINQQYFFSIYGFTILAQLFGASIYPKLHQRFTKQILFHLSAFLSIIGMLSLFTAGQLIKDNVLVIFLAASIKQIGSGLFMVTATHDLAWVIDVSSQKTEKAYPDILTSTKLLVAKLSTSLTSLGLGFGLYFAGYVNNQTQIPHTALLISLQTFGIPIILILISLLCYSLFRRKIQPLTTNRYAKFKS